jgi:hypothetical protein
LQPGISRYSSIKRIYLSGAKEFAAFGSEYYFLRGCVKRFFTALRAEFYFERHVIFTISRSEIVKMTCLSKEYFAAAGGKRLFT